MNIKEYDKLLLSFGIGKKFLGSGNILFDKTFTPVHIAEIDIANKWAGNELSWYKYGNEWADCETYHFMWYGRMLEWFVRKEIQKSGGWTFGPTWGMFNGQPHCWSFGVGEYENGLVLRQFNYSQIVEDVPFKSIGSING